MRHFDFLSGPDRERLFEVEPEPFGLDAPADLIGTALGATLYCPGTRPALARDIIRRAGLGAMSIVVCLEDSVADDDLAEAESNTVHQLSELADSGAALPMIFVRVRDERQIPMLLEGLGTASSVLAGFVVPKFGEETGGAYLETVVAATERLGRRLFVMPVLESNELAHLETRLPGLLGSRRLLDKYRDIVPAVRVGATDLSGAYGLRRPREFTVWDVRVVADAISAVVNVFGRSDAAAAAAGGPGGYIVSGPVWEYFSAPERMFKTQLRESPFVAHSDRALRAELLADDLDGLLREVALDRANGLTGKTVIHPSHVAAVHALSVVAPEEYTDACDVLSMDGRGGAAASSFGNKMNESKPHTAWARRTLLRAQVFGVARPATSFVDLLGASLHP